MKLSNLSATSFLPVLRGSLFFVNEPQRHREKHHHYLRSYPENPVILDILIQTKNNFTYLFTSNNWEFSNLDIHFSK